MNYRLDIERDGRVVVSEEITARGQIDAVDQAERIMRRWWRDTAAVGRLIELRNPYLTDAGQRPPRVVATINQ